MKEELEIHISPEGQVTLDVKGRKGKACLETVDAFKKLLGPVKEQKLTSEYYEGGSSTQTDLRRQ